MAVFAWARRSFDDLVGADQDRWRYCEVRGPGRLEINDKLELGRLLDGDVGRLPAFENEVDNLSAAPPLLAMIGAVGHNAACLYELAVAVDSGQVQTGGDRGNFGPLAEGERVLEDRKAASSCGLAGLELRCNLLRRADLEGPELYLRDMRCGLEL